MPNMLLPRLSTALVLTVALFAAQAAQAASEVQPWMGTPEGALMTRLEAIVGQCQRLADADTRYRANDGPMEDRAPTARCLDEGQKTGKDQLDLVSANSAFKLDLNTMYLKWSTWLASVSVLATVQTPQAKRAYEFAAGQLKARLNAANP